MDLSVQMTIEDKHNERPSCEAIIENRHLWELKSDEFDARKAFEDFCNSNDKHELFVYKIINLKLNYVNNYLTSHTMDY